MNLNNFNKIKTFNSRYLHFDFVVNEAKLPGYILEFGVYKANSINHIAKLKPSNTCYGFDSFEGLPEKWLWNKSKTVPAGHFALEELPKVVDNVKLIKGWFKDTIPKWKETHRGDISYMHIDSDLYSSCVTILTELNEYIVPGTVITFDELLEGKVYANWSQNEWKALHEWCAEFNREYEAISKTNTYSASIRVKK